MGICLPTEKHQPQDVPPLFIEWPAQLTEKKREHHRVASIELLWDSKVKERFSMLLITECIINSDRQSTLVDLSKGGNSFYTGRIQDTLRFGKYNPIAEECIKGVIRVSKDTTRKNQVRKEQLIAQVYKYYSQIKFMEPRTRD